jgi:hypothetical protein
VVSLTSGLTIEAPPVIPIKKVIKATIKISIISRKKVFEFKQEPHFRGRQYHNEVVDFINENKKGDKTKGTGNTNSKKETLFVFIIFIFNRYLILLVYF